MSVKRKETFPVGALDAHREIVPLSARSRLSEAADRPDHVQIPILGRMPVHGALVPNRQATDRLAEA